MLDHAAIQSLIPHQGAMCLLDSVAGWSEREIDCRSASHLDPGPIRCDATAGCMRCAAWNTGCKPPPCTARCAAAARRSRPAMSRPCAGWSFTSRLLDDPGAWRAEREGADGTMPIPPALIYGFQLFSAAGAVPAGRALASVVFRA